VCEHLPLTARHTDKVALIRSMTHPSNVHEASVYHTLTGKQNPTLVSPRNFRRRSDFPNFGSVLSALLPPGELPTCLTVPRPTGHAATPSAGTYAGWLGPRHAPMELREAPNSNDQPAHALALPADVDATRLVARRGLLDALDAEDRGLQAGRTAALGGFR